MTEMIFGCSVTSTQVTRKRCAGRRFLLQVTCGLGWLVQPTEMVISMGFSMGFSGDEEGIHQHGHMNGKSLE